LLNILDSILLSPLLDVCPKENNTSSILTLFTMFVRVTLELLRSHTALTKLIMTFV